MAFAACVSAAGCRPGVESPAPLEFYAASSLKDALVEIAPRCETANGVSLVFNFGASNDLARQIIAAGKADIFFSADEAWLEHVAAAGLVDAAERRRLLSNRLAVVVPEGPGPAISSAASLRNPAIRRLAIAHPDAVPAGKYARAWLEAAGVWDDVAARVLPSVDVRAALAAVESGAADAGIVYRTDAAISRRLRVAYEVPAGEGPEIVYAAAPLLGGPRRDAAARVVRWLAGPDAAAGFTRFGFLVIGPGR